MVPHLSDSLLAELLSVGGLVEVEVAAEDLVSALTAEHHLAAGGFDPSCQQEHGSRSPDRRQIKSLKQQIR